MSRAEKFIKEHIKRCSNLAHFGDINGNIWEEDTPWLTPDDARKSVEIAREEAIEQTVEWLLNNTHDYFDGYDEFAIFDVFKKQENIINDFKQAMNNET